MYPALKVFISDNKLMKYGKIWTHKRKKKVVLLSPPLLPSRFYCLKVDDIIESISYEFKKSLIARQKAGLSIGGHLSSA